MERSARQFLVLNDPAFRSRCQEVWSEAREALSALSLQLPKVPASELEAWVSQSESAWALLQTDPLQRVENQAVLAAVFVRLPAILAPDGPIPVSRSTWWAGVKTGRYPKPVKLGPRITAWRVTDIRRLIEEGAV